MNFQLSKVLLLTVVFLVPLLEATGSFGYEKIKVLFFILSISLIGFIWLWQKPKLKWNLIRIASAVFILVLLIGSIAGTDVRSSLLGSDPYFQGWIVYAYLGLLSVMVASARISLSEFAFAIVSSAALVSVSAIRQWVELDIFNLPISTYAGRVVSTFGQPNFYAGFLLLTLPFSYLLFKSPHKRWSMLGWGSGLLSMIGILVSFSRSAILLALLLLILAMIGQLKIKFKAGLVVVGIIALTILLALKFSSGIVGNEISGPILTKNPDLTRESVEKRAYIWPVAWQLIKQRPLTGYGLENIGQAFASYFETNKHLLFEENLKVSPVLISLKELNIDRAHNYLLDLLLFAGAFGLLGWLGLLGILLQKLIQNYHDRDSNVLLVGLGTYLIWVQFQNQSIVHLVYFWLLVGLIDQNS